MEELIRQGLRAVPVTTWGDRVVVGFNQRELARLFNIAYRPNAALDTREMSAKYEKVFQGAWRATRQIPLEYLDWVSPERDRTLRQFTFHLFDRPGRALHAYEVGIYTVAEQSRFLTEALRYATFEEIAQFGEDVLGQVRRALTGSPPLDLGGTLDSYTGIKTIGELLDLALGHSVHHLKQLYSYMERIGVKPEAPLGAPDFDGVAVPTELF